MTKALNWEKHNTFMKEMRVHHPAWGGMLGSQAIDGDVIQWCLDCYFFLCLFFVYPLEYETDVLIIFAVLYHCTLSPFFQDWGEHYFLIHTVCSS